MNPRLNRLFGKDGRCAVLAFDHGLFGEPSWLPGLGQLADVITTHASRGPDGMTLTTGSARLLQSLQSDFKPALLFRADITNGYLADRPTPMRVDTLARAVERAIMLDAVCVVAAILTFPGESTLRRDCVRSVDLLRSECDRWGMPLMIETLAMIDNPGVPGVEHELSSIAPLVRMAFEAGADIIKADPPQPESDFAALLDAAGGTPVLASGGMKADDEEIVRRTCRLLEAGANGIAYGRNVMWAADPPAMTTALTGLVHGLIDVEQAVDLIRVPGHRGRPQ